MSLNEMILAFKACWSNMTCALMCLIWAELSSYLVTCSVMLLYSFLYKPLVGSCTPYWLPSRRFSVDLSGYCVEDMYAEYVISMIGTAVFAVSFIVMLADSPMFCEADTAPALAINARASAPPSATRDARSSGQQATGGGVEGQDPYTHPQAAVRPSSSPEVADRATPPMASPVAAGAAEPAGLGVGAGVRVQGPILRSAWLPRSVGGAGSPLANAGPCPPCVVVSPASTEATIPSASLQPAQGSPARSLSDGDSSLVLASCPAPAGQNTSAVAVAPAPVVCRRRSQRVRDRLAGAAAPSSGAEAGAGGEQAAPARNVRRSTRVQRQASSDVGSTSSGVSARKQSSSTGRRAGAQKKAPTARAPRRRS